jgi:formamidopyrimidine-DNA glycosylase
MPELPEVETVRRGLEPALAGKRITRVVLKRRDLRIPFPRDLAERLTGRRVEALERRAKYILVHLEGGDTLIVHLGMSGRFTVYGPNSSAMAEKPGRFLHKVADDGSGEGKHDHVVLETEEGHRLVYTDHRRFGLMTLSPRAELSVHKLFKRLGPEPLSEAFTGAALSRALKGKKTPIKSALLDQRVVSGLGNIYVCEALHRAGISPKRLARSVAGPRAEKLVPIIKAVLNEAIAAGGSTLRDYAHADGELGYFQHSFTVYDREDEPCPTPGCHGVVKRLVQAGRSTFYCRVCQR